MAVAQVAVAGSAAVAVSAVAAEEAPAGAEAPSDVAAHGGRGLRRHGGGRALPHLAGAFHRRGRVAGAAHLHPRARARPGAGVPRAVPPDAVPALDAAEGVEAEGPAACRDDAERVWKQLHVFESRRGASGSRCTCVEEAAGACLEAAERVRKRSERVWTPMRVSRSRWT